MPAKKKTMPEVGDKAPAFALPGDLDGELRLADYKGKKAVLLYFYPKDDTPGCTKEACAFQKDLKKLTAKGVVVIGVSPDPLKAHEKFRKKYALAFPLASDDGAEIAKKYGVWVEKNLYGRKYMGVQRATFLIGKDGKVKASWPKVKVDGHAAAVLQALDEL
jgi:peroxiredoxin Q/BCP